MLVLSYFSLFGLISCFLIGLPSVSKVKLDGTAVFSLDNFYLSLSF